MFHVKHMDMVIRFLNGFLMIALPLALGAILVQRFRKPWRLFGIGVLTFLGSQALHLPFNGYVLAPILDKLQSTLASPASYELILSLLVGLSAGLFEEVARYVAFRSWIKSDRGWAGALVFGSGHGGIEAIILGGIALYALVQAISLRNSDLNALVPLEQVPIVESQLAAYWHAPWYVAILGAVERVFALCLHLSASAMVLQVFKRNNPLWLVGAICWHALANASALIALAKWDFFVSEGLLAIFAVLSVAIIFILRPQPSEITPSPTAPPQKFQHHPPGEISQEKIEDSRYA